MDEYTLLRLIANSLLALANNLDEGREAAIATPTLPAPDKLDFMQPVAFTGDIMSLPEFTWKMLPEAMSITVTALDGTVHDPTSSLYAPQGYFYVPIEYLKKVYRWKFKPGKGNHERMIDTFGERTDNWKGDVKVRLGVYKKHKFVQVEDNLP